MEGKASHTAHILSTHNTIITQPIPTHNSLELLESCSLISALLIEVPQMAANPLNQKRRMVSKSFHRILDTYSKQTFTGACGGWVRLGWVRLGWVGFGWLRLVSVGVKEE
jgi:hypothetical protein